MLAHLLAAAALAAAPSATDCTVATGDVDPASGLRTVEARCHWADIELDALTTMLAEPSGWERFVWCMSETRVIERSAAGALVWQRHEVSGAMPRENVVWTWSTFDDDGFEVRWVRADVAFAPSAGAVVPPTNEGSWHVAASPRGGVDVVHTVTYDPGGWVPTWIVRTIQTSGELRVLGDVRAAARSDVARS
jgi:hypothetical protein